MDNKDKLTSIIIPVKDEAEGIEHLFARLMPILEKLPTKYELVFINDGSNDNTLELLLEKQKDIPEIAIVDLSRNFGKEAALFAGFANCNGDAAISIDADLQDPPELILEMVQHWLDGYEVVTAVRENRDTDTSTKKHTAGLFYKVMNKISDTKLTPNAGDYRLLNRAAVNAFLELKEKIRFNKGLLTWIGFKEKIVYHAREERAAGQTKWNYWKLFKFSIDGITSFSRAPLEIWSYIGVVVALISFIYGSIIVLKSLLFGVDVPGYPSLVTFILFFSGLQMIGIGMLGSYIGRIFIETKHRPLYIIRQVHRAKE
ncbi:glycosyltransferase family 2 protein [Francisella tularensis subsp. novicida]|uniref:Glycosyltransferase family 2 protein n=2 Tax=Francisella tularensis TaxID=263 RepID=A0A6I4RMG1_FRATU|nr:glycosyltransferase family 2 protein [Francisella tularensis]ABK90273.1 glycosyl transferase [Francisella tularensis subsp. novicida U112]AJI60634.1 glycosyl transferase 2 family protein [Francisella tularensis subsp. novicida U112]EDX20044.1 glycosyl transferase, group 2 family protein [Francisella tularensis subsp. novicida FTE]MBK2036272.1 glycosyltransferase family 2 protein [Francisella tularensis subsp. novicida]MBK2116792.1 glycosyltransferase family 2 protein [Francisella tularensis